MIRPYRSTDLEAVLDIWSRASVIAHSFLPAEFFERERSQIAERWMPVAETIVAEADSEAGDDRVVGFLSLVGNEVGAIFVDPDEQGHGLGRALMDAARAARPYLELDVFEANTIGRRFYEAYGFRVVDRHMNEVAGFPELRLRLDGPAGQGSWSEAHAD